MKILAYALWLVMLLATVAGAQTVPWIGEGNHGAHDYSFGPVQIAAGLDLANVLIDPAKKSQLAGIEKMRVNVLMSRDGGLTYLPIGGMLFDSSNQPADFSLVLPDIANQARVLQGTITIYGGNWKGSVDVVLE